MTKTKLREALRCATLDFLKEALATRGDEILVVGTNEVAIPVVDADGNDEFVIITVKVPTGSRDGEPYDGYAMAQDFAMKCEAKAEKARLASAKKAEKIAKDKATREAKAKAKADREAK